MAGAHVRSEIIAARASWFGTQNGAVLFVFDPCPIGVKRGAEFRERARIGLRRVALRGWLRRLRHAGLWGTLIRRHGLALRPVARRLRRGIVTRRRSG